MSSLLTGQADVPVPTGQRSAPQRWRDPRLLLGVVIVAGSVLLGSSVLSRADDTVQVWAVRRSLPAGARIGSADLARVPVRFVDGAERRYLPVGGSSPAGQELLRGVGPGELLPAGAITERGRAAEVQVPLPVAVADLPSRLGAGAVVDVWVAPRDPAADPGEVRARRVLHDVVVVAVPGSDEGLAPTTEGTVVVAVRGGDDLAAVLGTVLSGRVVLTVRSVP